MFGLFGRRKKQEQELLEGLMRAAAEGEQRAKINRALGSLGIQLAPEDDNAEYCIKISAAFVRAIMEAHGTQLKSVTDDDIFAGGVFLLAVSSHITRVVGAQFEMVSAIALIELFGQSESPNVIREYVGPIIKTYNQAAQNSNFIQAIGQNFVKFIAEPQQDQFDKLVKLYQICLNGMK